MKERSTWAAMKRRCLRPDDVSFRHYGGRGISVCPEWLESFDAFYRDMGPAPSPEHSIDRIDNNGNYEPGNCRWATRAEQSRNRRNNRLLTFRGETLTVTDWAARIGICPGTITYRLEHLGMSVYKALSTPSDPSTRGRLSWVNRRKTMEERRLWRLANAT